MKFPIVLICATTDPLCLLSYALGTHRELAMFDNRRYWRNSNILVSQIRQKFQHAIDATIAYNKNSSEIKSLSHSSNTISFHISFKVKNGSRTIGLNLRNVSHRACTAVLLVTQGDTKYEQVDFLRPSPKNNWTYFSLWKDIWPVNKQ